MTDPREFNRLADRLAALPTFEMETYTAIPGVALTDRERDMIVTALRTAGAESGAGAVKGGEVVRWEWLHPHPIDGSDIWRTEQYWNGYTSKTSRPLYAALTEPAKAGDAVLLREAFVHTLASLAAAISLLERTPQAKKAAPSDKMFAQMIVDYKNALEAGRQAALSTAQPDTAARGGKQSDGGGGSRPAFKEERIETTNVHEDRTTSLAAVRQMAGVAPGPSDTAPAREPVAEIIKGLRHAASGRSDRLQQIAAIDAAIAFLYAHPPRSVDIEAIARVIDPDAGWGVQLHSDYIDLRHEQTRNEEQQRKALAAARSIAAMIEGLPSDPIAPAAPVSVDEVVLIDVAAERKRQREVEGWTPEHDDTHISGEMARAAICYADPLNEGRDYAPVKWPWSPGWWKPKDRRRDLVRAAALIVAEIERLDRRALLDAFKMERK